MLQVVCTAFGGPDVLQLEEVLTPEPGPGQVLVRLTSIGMNHADLMSRRGEYKLSSGDPPFVPGIEGGGIIEKVGPDVSSHKAGDRVILGSGVPRRDSGGMGGTYRSHYVCRAEEAIFAPDTIPDDQLGAIWLAYLTAWGCLVWKESLQPGKIVAFPAASSSVALAGAQIAKKLGAVTVGMTTSAAKADALRQLPESRYDHMVVTHGEDRQMKPWHRELKKITASKGVDVFFDPVASGEYLDYEIRSLADHGTIYVYGLLGEPGKVDVTPLIRKFASIRGWLLGELRQAGSDALERGYREVLEGFQAGDYVQHLGGKHPLAEAAHAHEEMERGAHVGKLVLIP